MKIKKVHYHILEYNRIKSILIKMKEKSLNNFLEVGFGKGKYLKLAQELRFDTNGVEINQEYVNEAKLMGFKCFHTSEIEAINQKFDIVLMSHVIEHLGFEELHKMLTYYINMLSENGVLIIATPLMTERFYYDFTHVRPYYPQSIWHAFGTNNDEISIGRKDWILNLEDIYFINDTYKTRKLRSYYIKDGLQIFHYVLKFFNYILALLYLLSKGIIGVKMSWIGVYKKQPINIQ